MCKAGLPLENESSNPPYQQANKEKSCVVTINSKKKTTKKSIWWKPISMLSKLGIEGNYLTLINSLYINLCLTLWTSCYQWKTKCISPKIRNKRRMVASIILNTGSSLSSIKQEKQTKGIQIGKEEIQLFYLKMTWLST